MDRYKQIDSTLLLENDDRGRLNLYVPKLLQTDLFLGFLNSFNIFNRDIHIIDDRGDEYKQIAYVIPKDLYEGIAKGVNLILSKFHENPETYDKFKYNKVTKTFDVPSYFLELGLIIAGIDYNKDDYTYFKNGMKCTIYDVGEFEKEYTNAVALFLRRVLTNYRYGSLVYSSDYLDKVGGNLYSGSFYLTRSGLRNVRVINNPTYKQLLPPNELRVLQDVELDSFEEAFAKDVERHGLTFLYRLFLKDISSSEDFVVGKGEYHTELYDGKQTKSREYFAKADLTLYDGKDISIYVINDSSFAYEYIVAMFDYIKSKGITSFNLIEKFYYSWTGLVIEDGKNREGLTITLAKFIEKVRILTA